MKIIFNPIAVLSLLTLGCGRERHDPLLLDPGQVAQQFPPLPEQQFQENFEEMIEFDEEYHIQAGTIHFEGWEGYNDSISLAYTTVVYFEDFGRKERKDTYDEKGKLLGVVLNDGQDLYFLDYKEKIAKRLKGNWYGTEVRFDWALKIPNDWGMIIRTGNEIVAGKDCDVIQYQIEGGEAKYGGWGNILFLLESSSSLWGDYYLRANEFVEGSPDAGLFEIPQDYIVVE